jgi:long-chain acyl-CoA synthetase
MTDDDVLFVCGDLRVTRSEYRHRVARAASVLRDMGLGPGGCVGIALRNRPQFFELVAAASLLQAKAVPIAWRLKREEVRYLIEDSGAQFVVSDSDSAEQMAGLPGLSLQDYEDRLAQAAPAEDLDLASNRFSFELYSSGTTGRPKAIERDFSTLTPEKLSKLGAGSSLAHGRRGSGRSPFDVRADVPFAADRLCHHRPRARPSGGDDGGSFDAETCLATIEREKVTWITCVPTHFIRILALPDDVRRRYDLSSLKAVLHSAAPCPLDVKRAIIDLLPPDTVWEIYGGTEGAITMVSPQEWLHKPGSVGRGFPPGTPLHILDGEGRELPPGEVGLIYAPPLMNFRYRGAPELDAQTWRAGLYTLGDMGYLDADGYLFVTDRMKDMIISGGANIYPAEVEAVLFNHPAVGDAAVIGVPDPQWGESVKAIVERRADASADEIITFCRERLAHYKCPTSVDFVERLSRDPNGKVRKRELREAYWADAGRRV